MPDSDAEHLPPLLASVPRDRWPKHVAIIMDGNGRWARRHGKPRSEGHRQGALAVRPIVEECARLGLRQLTLYAFSHENWRRPRAEITALMKLYEWYLQRERKLMMERNIRFRNVGRRKGLPASVIRRIEDVERTTEGNDGMTLALAVNYGGRQEIVDAARQLAREAAEGELDAEEIGEETVANRLYPGGREDVDMLVRTAGELRVSNFLLWQISYAEIVVSDVYWPDFDAGELHKAIAEFAGRRRRFGGLEDR